MKRLRMFLVNRRIGRLLREAGWPSSQEIFSGNVTVKSYADWYVDTHKDPRT